MAALADRTEVVCEWFFEPATMAAEGFDPTDAIEFWDKVNREDWHVCELTQKGVRTAGYSAGRYSAEEVDVHAFDLDGRRALHGGAARTASAGAGVNEIAAKLGEVGLPEPVAELAARDWDAIVVGGGHNGLTAAAYLARAGTSASSCSSAASGSAAPAPSSGRSTTSATWSAPAPTSSACSTTW